MTRTSLLRTGLTALAALVLLTVCSPLAQAQTTRGADFKCGNNMDAGVIATATLTWYQGTTVVGGPDPAIPGPYTFTCTPGTTDSKDVVQPLGADNWKVDVILVGGGCSPCTDSATGIFVADEFPRIHERFTNFSVGTPTFVLQRK
jgi:hypothetical protein